MTKTYEGSVAVIVAHRFNLTAANQYWLVKEGIVDEGDFAEGTIFSDGVVQARTSKFHMLILPDQLQFVPIVDYASEQEIVTGRLGKLVGKLPHVPYKGMGINFGWHLAPDDGDTSRMTKSLFYNPDRSLFRSFNTNDARFGAYLSKDFNGFRLKLDVKPIVMHNEGGSSHRVRMGFNFHCDLGPPNPADEIQSRLVAWNELRTEAERIVADVESEM